MWLDVLPLRSSKIVIRDEELRVGKDKDKRLTRNLKKKNGWMSHVEWKIEEYLIGRQCSAVAA